MAAVQQGIYMPTVTEDDLLAFQFSHFDDYTKPDDWFVGAETALNADEQGDGLGYYPDGVKRTLTDEQIAMFRHSEIQDLLRERRLLREELAYESADGQSHEKVGDAEDAMPQVEREASPFSDTSTEASSIEGDLIAATNPDHDYEKLQRPDRSLRPHRSDSISSHTTSNATSNNAGGSNGPGEKLSRSTRSRRLKARRKRRREAKKDERWQAQLERERIPYEQRHKRKWEKYVQEEDSNGHSLTERRIVRQLDGAKQGELELDY
ncbi:Protein of unknown function (DUF3807) [Teratosphaeria destructans]|uniref:Uncharacterized protein n=1 Tax=Teratosphaeria destructans TaxID=418781 RepID=A0A9W7W583_9PEZI|nr:Protein of unknown function (DUF3807) [Teratosphaeria destructans]